MAKEEKKRKSKSHDKEKKDRKKHKTSSKKAERSAKSESPVIAKTTTTTTYSSFSEIVAQIYLHLAPMWAENSTEGVIEQLNAFLMKFVPQLDGIVLAHSNLEFLTDKGKILYDSPFSHFFVRVKFLVWKPKRGTKLVGRINLQSQDHIGLLIYGTFNASIPSRSIPSDTFEWRASETESEPVAVEAESAKDDDDDEEEEQQQQQPEAVEEKPSQYGEWVNKSTGVPIGGEDGTVEFNVVDIVEANDILTVTGSL